MAKAKGPKMPVKTVTVSLVEDGYPEGFEIDMRTNAPPRLIKRFYGLTDESEDRDAEEILLKLFPGWRLWDDDGNPIPHSAAGLELIDRVLLQIMLWRRTEAIREAVMPGPLGSGSSTKGSRGSTASQPPPETEAEGETG